MNALAARVTAVNDIAEQLLKANPPGKDRITGTQQQLNHRWACGGEAAPKINLKGKKSKFTY